MFDFCYLIFKFSGKRRNKLLITILSYLISPHSRSESIYNDIFYLIFYLLLCLIVCVNVCKILKAQFDPVSD